MFNDLVKEIIGFTTVNLISAKKRLTHFSATQIADSQRVMTESVVNFMFFDRKLRVLSRSVAIHKGRGFGRLLAHISKAFQQSAFGQFKRIFKGIPETIQIRGLAFALANAVLDAQFGEDNGNRNIVATTNALVAKAMSVVADEGSTRLLPCHHGN